MKRTSNSTNLEATRNGLGASRGDPAGATGVPAEPLTLTIPNASLRTGISRSELYRLMAARKITARKSGKRTLLIWSSLKAHVEGLPPATFRSPNSA
jgi:hypothetical protein